MIRNLSDNIQTFFLITGWRKSQFYGFVFLLTLVAVLELAFIFGITAVVSVRSNIQYEGYTHILYGGLAIVFFVKIFSLVWQSYYIGKKVFSIFENLFFRIMKSICLPDFNDKTSLNTDELKSKLGIDLNQVQINYVFPSISLISELLVSLILLIGLLILYPVETLILLCTILVFGLGSSQVLSKLAYRAGRTREIHEAKRGGLGTYVVNNRMLLSTDQSIQKIRDAHGSVIKSLGDAWRQQVFFGALPKPTFEMAGYIGIAIIFLVYNQNNSNTQEMFVSFGAAGLRLLPSANRIALSIQYLSYNKTTVENLVRMLSRDQTVHNKIDIKRESKENFQIQFDNFNVAPGGISLWSKSINQVVSGNVIGIKGQSGIGKSTIGYALCQKVPHTGSVLLTGPFDRTTTSREFVRLVETSEHLLHSSIAAELQLFAKKDLTLSQLEGFLHELGLGELTREITSSNWADHLSTGQYQRLVFLRAWLQEYPVYVFDEITSALDQNTETTLVEFVKKYRKNQLIIFITHSKSILRHCDDIINIGNKATIA